MKKNRLLAVIFMISIIPVRVLGEEINVYNSTVEAEENIRIQDEKEIIEEKEIIYTNENIVEEQKKEKNTLEDNNEDIINDDNDETEELEEADINEENNEESSNENINEDIKKETESEQPEEIYTNINYSTHIQNIGWQKEFDNGEIAGTTGRSLRLEAIKIKLDSSIDGEIEYEAHVQNIGWQGYVKNGNIAGTTGRSLRLEAIRIKLTGKIAEEYDIYYRTHIENYGWLGWTKNGESSGSQGLSLRLEALEIKLVKKDDNSIEIQDNSFINKETKITYQAHVQNIGNQNIKNENEVAGTTGRSLRLEAIKINLDTTLSGNIEYQSYVEKNGWEEKKTSNGEFSGTTGKSKAIQLIRINLTDQLEEKYDIYYRVHSEMYGWLDWAKNGEVAGVNHYSIEAIQIKLFLKTDINKNNLSTKTHYIENVSYKPVHFMQKDKRWNTAWYGRYQFGRTGCAPTSMAMAFTGILGYTILPTQIGNYLYNNTNEFNKKNQGSSGQAILLASNYYNVKATPLNNKEEIENALKNGKIVYAAMGNGKYGKPTYNHAIIFFGYNNGITIVYDPLNSNDNYESIDLLWNEQSKDPDDYSGGSNFYSLERY